VQTASTVDVPLHTIPAPESFILRGIVCEGVEWIKLAHRQDKRSILVVTINNREVP
jgi:hypothetical protein